jgi:hypothetical protein
LHAVFNGIFPVVGWQRSLRNILVGDEPVPNCPKNLGHPDARWGLKIKQPRVFLPAESMYRTRELLHFPRIERSADALIGSQQSQLA